MSNIIVLNHDGQFQRLYKKGKNFVTPALIIYTKKNGLSCTRLGITASRKIGKAVVRNRAKRRIRELFRINLDSIKTGFDIVIVARGKTARVPYPVLRSAFFRAAAQVGILAETSETSGISGASETSETSETSEIMETAENTKRE